MRRSELALAAAVLALGAFVGHAWWASAGHTTRTAGRLSRTAPASAAPLPAAAPAPAPEAAPGVARAGALERPDAAPLAGEDVERTADGTAGGDPLALDPADAWARLAQGAAGTYIDDVLRERDAALARWGDRRAEPVRVWIADGQPLDGWQAGDSELVRDAFDEWARTGIPVRFVFVRDSAGADVRVGWVRRFAEPIHGRTTWTRDPRWWIRSAEVVLALEHEGGGRLDAAQLRAIALHEVGHVLGLDHARAPEHIMAPQVRTRALSDGDRATLRLLYSVPAGRVRLP